MTDTLRELLDALIRDRAHSGDIPWHTTEIIDAIDAELKREATQR